MEDEKKTFAGMKENNGGGKSEDIEIVRIMEQHLTHLSRYKR